MTGDERRRLAARLTRLEARVWDLAATLPAMARELADIRQAIEGTDGHVEEPGTGEGGAGGSGGG